MRDPAPSPRRLYHYCCDHSVAGILADDALRVVTRGRQPKASEAVGVDVYALGVIWLTDIDILDTADAQRVGLELKTGIGSPVTCDRTAYRFRVPAHTAEWWPEWADTAAERGLLPEGIVGLWPGYRVLLERDRAPRHWWVSTAPIRAPRLDERYGQAPAVLLG